MRKKNVVLQQLAVADYAAEGKALGKVDGKVVFVEGAVPGDVVDVRLTKNKKDWAEGKAIHFHQYSPDRVDPFCEHFGVCGGCKWQMLPYDKQLLYKQNEVAQNLRRLGRIELPPLMPILGCADTARYRNKLEFTFSNRRYLLPGEMELGVGSAESGAGSLESGAGSAEPEVGGREPGTGGGENALGFHVPRLFDKVIDIHTCHLMQEPTNRIKNTLRQFALEQGYPFYDIRHHTGWLRTLVLRVCTTGEVMVNLVLAYEDEPERRKLLDHLLAAVPGITTLVYTINPKKNDSLYDLEPQTYHGKGYVTEMLEDFRFKVGPKSFFQTNTRQGERLYQVARDFAELTGRETVYDLYCGTGSIGLFVSGGAARVVGVEVVAEAVEDAKANAALNGIGHASFFAGDVIEVCSDAFFEQQGRPDVIITDPPRAGMHEKLVRKILDMAASTVVYVSCNPATQARDLQLLDEKYRVTKIQPVDMFPQTHHIENVVQLKLK